MSFGAPVSLTRTGQSTILVLISVGLFALLSLIAKVLGTDIMGHPLHPAQISAARFIVAFLVLLPLIPFQQLGHTRVPWGLHVRRSVSGWLDVTCLFSAATQMSLADANAVSFLSIVVALALSFLVLKERVGIYRWTAALVALLGALLITRPGTSAFQPAALMALSAALFIGFEIIFIKQLSGRESVFRILLINNLIGAAISILVLGFVWQSPTIQQWYLIVTIGALMLVVQSANGLAMKRSDARLLSWNWPISDVRTTWTTHPEPVLGPEPAEGYPDFKSMIHPDDVEQFGRLWTDV